MGKKTSILVTGGAGFIGSHIVDSLVEDGYEVVIVDKLTTGQQENINTGAEFFNISICDYKVRELFEKYKFKYVFHLAAEARIQSCTDEPLKSHSTNVTGTLKLLELSRKHKVKGFIFSSSSAVYGDVETNFPIRETQSKNPVSIYGAQKLAAEHYVLLYNKFYNLPTVALRYFNVYGTARQNEKGPYPTVFVSFNKSLRDNGRITIYGDGEQQRDFIHVFDVVRANLMWLDKKDGWGQAYNVGTNQATTINKIATYFTDNIDYKEARSGDPRYSCANMSKLDFKAEISLEEGIKIFKKSL